MIALRRRGARAQRARKVDFPLPLGAGRRYIVRRETMGRDQLEEYGWSDEDLDRLRWPPTVNAYVLEPGHLPPIELHHLPRPIPRPLRRAPPAASAREGDGGPDRPTPHTHAHPGAAQSTAAP